MTATKDHTTAPISMTDEQKFFFDLHGWIMLPSVLTADEIEPLKKEVYDGAKQAYQGELQTLLDHPAVNGILNEILSEDPYPGEDYYNYRCENSFITVREPGWKKPGPSTPHVVRPPQQANAMRYQVAGNKIFSGLTRVVWEVEDVKAGSGGTTFLSGSHKAHFNYGGPDPYRPNISESAWEESLHQAMAEYNCPAGSVIIFTESLLHAANDWTNPDNSRCAVFNCYDSLWAQWHKVSLSHETIEAMPPRRRTLFRGVWGAGNKEYSQDNRAL